MKRIIAGLLTVALMGVLLWSGRNRPAAPAGSEPNRAGSNAPDPAEVRLGSLLESAWNGDVAGYLDCFGGPLRERLEREVSERGRDVFAADLKRGAVAQEPRHLRASSPKATAAARITVETVYPDRNERQTYRLARRPAAGSSTTSRPYGARSPRPGMACRPRTRNPKGSPFRASPSRASRSGSRPT